MITDIVAKIKGKFGASIGKCEEKSARRIYVDIATADIREISKFLFRDLGLRFAITTGIDTPAGIEMLYHFSHDASGKMVTLRAIITDRKAPQIDSLAPLITGAEWIEREIWEMLGVKFIGHPNLTHLLLIDDWPEGKFPLRKKNVA